MHPGTKAFLYLRLAAFVAYLLSWFVFAAAMLWSSLPRLERRLTSHEPGNTLELLGTVLQIGAAGTTTLFIPSGALRPGAVALAAILILSPLAAALFCWCVRQAPRRGAVHLVTTGPYAVVRHPLYLALYLMLAATLLLVTSAAAFALATALYAAGTALRVRAEERQLADRYSRAWTEYRERTRWRFVPGLL